MRSIEQDLQVFDVLRRRGLLLLLLQHTRLAVCVGKIDAMRWK